MSADPSNQYEDLLTDLLYLRKGEGFTLTKARNASTFLFFMGGAGQTFEELSTRFISAICSVEEDESVEVMLIAYGLEPGYDELSSLKERREKYGWAIGRKVDTVADLEQAAIQELAIRILLSHWVNAPLPANIPVIHGDFICETLRSTVLIRDRCLVETRETQRLIALADNLASFDYSTNENSEVVAEEGCRAPLVYREAVLQVSDLQCLHGKRVRYGPRNLRFGWDEQRVAVAVADKEAVGVERKGGFGGEQVVGLEVGLIAATELD